MAKNEEEKLTGISQANGNKKTSHIKMFGKTMLTIGAMIFGYFTGIYFLFPMAIFIVLYLLFTKAFIINKEKEIVIASCLLFTHFLWMAFGYLMLYKAKQDIFASNEMLLINLFELMVYLVCGLLLLKKLTLALAVVIVLAELLLIALSCMNLAQFISGGLMKNMQQVKPLLVHIVLRIYIIFYVSKAIRLLNIRSKKESLVERGELPT